MMNFSSHLIHVITKATCLVCFLRESNWSNRNLHSFPISLTNGRMLIRSIRGVRIDGSRNVVQLGSLRLVEGIFVEFNRRGHGIFIKSDRHKGGNSSRSIDVKVKLKFGKKRCQWWKTKSRIHAEKGKNEIQKTLHTMGYSRILINGRNIRRPEQQHKGLKEWYISRIKDEI